MSNCVSSWGKPVANNAINADSEKRRAFVAPLFTAGYGECYAARKIFNIQIVIHMPLFFYEEITDKVLIEARYFKLIFHRGYSILPGEIFIKHSYNKQMGQRQCK
ncbi:MAG: hypothetical protein E3K38_10825 [Candidatus Kuenenia stuttgartiensis]|nr:hypothetical protein [Candidatus Kuenenia stuttgartiensis]